MAEYYVPKIQYPVGGTILQLSRSSGYWTRRNPTTGGMREAAGGTAAAAFEIRTDYLLEWSWRFTEAEYAAVESAVLWGQRNPNTLLTMWPDSLMTPGTSYAAVWRGPVMGEEFAPNRMELASDFEHVIKLRRSPIAAWPLSWFVD